jgi:hypothetical protein
MAAAIFFANRITSNIYVVRVGLGTMVQQNFHNRSQVFRPAMHLMAIFCSVNALPSYFLQL